MIEVISLSVVCLILMGVLGISYYVLKQRPKAYSAGFRELAQRLSYSYSEAGAALERAEAQLAQFYLFQKVGKHRVRALVWGQQNGTSFQLMSITSTRQGLDQPYPNFYTAILFSSSHLDLPRFTLRSAGSKLEEKLNKILFQAEAGIDLGPYPALSKAFVLTGTPLEDIRQLFYGQVGRYFNHLAERSLYRNVEGHSSQLLYYKYQPTPASCQELEQLLEESRQLFALVDQAT
jgi:hypothetical protein